MLLVTVAQLGEHNFYKEVFILIGIYKITNKINGKSYIGQSIDIVQRWRSHRIKAYNTAEYNYPLYRAIRKYGIENFTFEVIQECSKEQLNELEQYYINYFNTFSDGYNQTLGGDSTSFKLASEQVLGIIKDLQETNLSQLKIAEKWGVHENTVQTINVGKHWHFDREYPIRKKEVAKKNYCIDCQTEIWNGAKRCKKCCALSQRVADRPTREQLKELIRNYSFVKIGQQFNVSDNTIRKWCDYYCLPRKKTEIDKYSDEEWANK